MFRPRHRSVNMFLTIDTGTTNTRIYLVDGETVKDSIKINAGAGDTVKTGSNQILKESIQNGICRLLSDNTLKEQDICAVFASGMITSELGALRGAPCNRAGNAFVPERTCKNCSAFRCCVRSHYVYPGCKKQYGF